MTETVENAAQDRAEAAEARAEAAERERDELRRDLDMGFVEVRGRMQAAEAKLAAIQSSELGWTLEQSEDGRSARIVSGWRNPDWLAATFAVLDHEDDEEAAIPCVCGHYDRPHTHDGLVGSPIWLDGEAACAKATLVAIRKLRWASLGEEDRDPLSFDFFQELDGLLGINTGAERD